MCPYYNTDSKYCNFYPSSTLDESTKENKCLSDSNWKYCDNYTNRSYDEKVNKRLRPNPEL